MARARSTACTAFLFLLGAVLLGSCGGGGGGGAGTGGGGGGASGPVVHAWVTTADQTRLLSPDPDAQFGSASALAINIDVDATVQYQSMVGFGAALTDSAAYLLHQKLTTAQRSALLQELYGPAPGLHFSLARLTLAASDFSLTQYSYDDLAPGLTDPGLASWSFAPATVDVVPMAQQMRAMNPSLQFLASPWSPPAWMKTGASLLGASGGTLRTDSYDAYANYLLRGVQAWSAQGIDLYAISVQNEPAYGPADYPGMVFAPADRIAFVGGHLGPLFAAQGVTTRLLEWDHNWDQPAQPLQVLADPVASPYIAGTAWHCYGGDVSAQGAVHAAYPGKDVFFTECSGTVGSAFGPDLAWNLHNLVIGATRNWARGVLLWNLALDPTSGPHSGGCTACRGLLTIDPGTGAITRNVEYYALAHASRFVAPGAVRIDSTSGVGGIESVAFRNPDGSTALVLLNTNASATTFSVRASGQTVARTLPAGAVATLTW